ncbi:hypothetical protein BDR04DRAFT_1103851 [Suillus decipiens]|nr:hypothetical protein BDR04DRAFT_1103851 [Suillus decipiens]
MSLVLYLLCNLNFCLATLFLSCRLDCRRQVQCNCPDRANDWLACQGCQTYECPCPNDVSETKVAISFCQLTECVALSKTNEFEAYWNELKECSDRL